MSNNVFDGDVHFKENEGMHVNTFSITETGEAVDNGYLVNRTRVAYLIVSLKETRDLAGDEYDKDAILEIVKDKYAPYLTQAIEQESKNLTLPKLKTVHEEQVENKLVKLQTNGLAMSKSYGDFLRRDYTYAYNKLDASLKKEGEKKSYSLLKFSRGSSDAILEKEQRFSRQTLRDALNIAPKSYIIVSAPYVYNLKKDTQTEELEVITYEQSTAISFMPELVVEYGIFYDGTKNNMYNIEFYRNFREFLKEPAEYIEQNKYSQSTRLEQKPEREFARLLDYILREEDPQLTPEYLKLIMNQIDNAPQKIRYFDKPSNLNQNDARVFQSVLNSKKADDAKAVFHYFVDVKHGKDSADEATRGAFVQKKILPENGDSSYTNGKTNIERLYQVYDGDDVRTNKDALSVTRFKLYESGSGTHNPYVEDGYKSDNALGGLGLGTDATGAVAHIIYSCEKMAYQLREANITHIDELVLDIFGFSRGATSARHFICSILKDAELIPKGNREYSVRMKDGKDIFEPFYGKKGYVEYGGKIFFNPLRIDIKDNGKEFTLNNPFYLSSHISIDSLSFRFVGIYDTVTHYGFSQANDHKNLNIDFFANEGEKKLGQVFHLMADDEYRNNFQTFSIFQKPRTKFWETKSSLRTRKVQFEEITFPGAHADLGGGYNKKAESVKLGFLEFRSHDHLARKINKWNKKHHWLLSEHVEGINSDSELEKKEQEGFYYIVNTHIHISERGIPSRPTYTATVYMHKPLVQNTYEHVTLRLMHDRAIYDDNLNKVKKDGGEMVPLGGLKAYDFSKDDTLQSTYNRLLKIREPLKNSKDDTELYKKLKDSYLHHSSNRDLYVEYIVNGPSTEEIEDGEFYGKRVIYTSTGEKYTL
ncbi:T6SS phospholipase effector Tle1-like catalytic domain-containing protein [Sulfurimonas sp.]|uniref:T6SS phospholipase effector Tle1-like catalytic domain-containing protein n=1 Tax=Sulfurimonas sp. TaxID=2022749 RepID=UPI003D0DD800